MAQMQRLHGGWESWPKACWDGVWRWIVRTEVYRSLIVVFRVWGWYFSAIPLDGGIQNCIRWHHWKLVQDLQRWVGRWECLVEGSRGWKFKCWKALLQILLAVNRAFVVHMKSSYPDAEKSIHHENIQSPIPESIDHHQGLFWYWFVASISVHPFRSEHELEPMPIRILPQRPPSQPLSPP